MCGRVHTSSNVVQSRHGHLEGARVTHLLWVWLCVGCFCGRHKEAAKEAEHENGAFLGKSEDSSGVVLCVSAKTTQKG